MPYRFAVMQINGQVFLWREVFYSGAPQSFLLVSEWWAHSLIRDLEEDVEGRGVMSQT